AKKPDNTPDTGLAAPTMATDGVRVYVLYGTGDAAALDFEGNRVWAKNLGAPENHYGHSSSLITFRDLLLVQYDQNTGGHLIALSAKTGDIVYDQTRTIEISWASPILVNTGSRFEVILNSSPEVVSHDPATGRELWRVDCMGGEVAPSLAYADGMVFAVNETAKLAAISLSGTPKVLWESKDDLAEVSSPLAAGDFVFVATSYGTVSCFDRKTGERYWFEDLPKGFYSSPVLAGNNVYLMDMEGMMYIFKTGKKYEPVSTCELGEKAVTVPAFMSGRIYIRGFQNLYCIGE
ncbi:MAG: outer membrane protein assembly factor BamB family protein, partial [Candidatus Latescibacterota bacterium]